jgi:D-amino-acid dehydrogenase
VLESCIVKIVVLGSGVIGVASAYFLARAGHEVVVLDRQEGPALETSFANAGEVSPGYSAPWAAPGIPLKALKWLFMRHRPLVIWPKPDPAMWLWGLRMLRNCTAERYAHNKGLMLPIAHYSRDILQELRRDTNIAYDQRMQGTLQLFRLQKQMDGIGADTAVLAQTGIPFEVLDIEGCLKVEPGLKHVREKFVGGLRLPQDETGDCFKFTQSLRHLAEQAGASFLYQVTINGLIRDGDRIAAVDTNGGRVTADAYVVAMGSYSPQLLRPLGLKLPVYPVKGYSLTLPVTAEDGAPQSTVMDETHKVAITRLGDRIRVGGTAELAGFNLDLREGRRSTLTHVVSDLFPKGGDAARAAFWCGLRPMTPDGPPIIGGTRYSNLYLNTGHGTLGWTMACGSGRIMADLLSGRRPEIDISGLGLERYHGL